MLKKQDSAPDFTLQDPDEKNISLKDYKGKWVVLYFYPKDNTPGCTTEACDFSISITDFNNLNAVVLGVSPDSPASHRKFIEKQSLKITLLSDPEHKVLELYNAWGNKKMYGKEYMGVIRTTYIITPDQKIAEIWPKVKVKGHITEVINKLNELK